MSSDGSEVGKYYFNLHGDRRDLSTWRQADGQRIFIHESWYQSRYLTVPDRKNFARGMT